MARLTSTLTLAVFLAPLASQADAQRDHTRSAPIEHVTPGTGIEMPLGGRDDVTTTTPDIADVTGFNQPEYLGVSAIDNALRNPQADLAGMLDLASDNPYSLRSVALRSAADAIIRNDVETVAANMRRVNRDFGESAAANLKIAAQTADIERLRQAVAKFDLQTGGQKRVLDSLFLQTYAAPAGGDEDAARALAAQPEGAGITLLPENPALRLQPSARTSVPSVDPRAGAILQAISAASLNGANPDFIPLFNAAKTRFPGKAHTAFLLPSGKVEELGLAFPSDAGGSGLLTEANLPGGFRSLKAEERAMLPILIVAIDPKRRGIPEAELTARIERALTDRPDLQNLTLAGAEMRDSLAPRRNPLRRYNPAKERPRMSAVAAASFRLASGAVSDWLHRVSAYLSAGFQPQPQPARVRVRAG